VRLFLCRASNISAVPYFFAVRPSPLPCVERCRAFCTFPWVAALPCVFLCRAASFAVRRTTAFAVRRSLSCLAKPPPLPCAVTKTHGKATWQYKLGTSRQRTTRFFCFFLFFINSLHFKIANTYIFIYITSNTSNT
jgi:hypothetical protein